VPTVIISRYIFHISNTNDNNINGSSIVDKETLVKVRVKDREWRAPVWFHASRSGRVLQSSGGWTANSDEWWTDVTGCKGRVPERRRAQNRPACAAIILRSSRARFGARHRLFMRLRRGDVFRDHPQKREGTRGPGSWHLKRRRPACPPRPLLLLLLLLLLSFGRAALR